MQHRQISFKWILHGMKSFLCRQMHLLVLFPFVNLAFAYLHFKFCSVEESGCTAQMMSPSPPWQADESPVLLQAEAACLQYNIWFSPYSTNDSSSPTLIITMRIGRSPLVMTTQLMAAAVLTTPINPAWFWHQLAGSSQSSLILDCTPPFYRSAMINAPSAIKNMRCHKLHDPTWNHSMSLLRWV